MMYWLGLVLFAYLLVALLILGSIICQRHRVIPSCDYRTADIVAMTIFCAFLWPLAMYRGKLKINFK